MRLQLGEIRPMLEALPAILDKELPLKVSYWLGRAFRQLQTEFLPFEEARQKLVERHGARNSEGKLVTDGNVYKLENMEAFQAEFDELANQEIEIKYEPIDIDLLAHISLTPIDVLKLGRLLKNGIEEEE